MIISLRKVGGFIRFIVLFTVLTVFFYHALSLVNRWLIPMDPYRVPTGHAVKAFQPENSVENWVTPRERLRLYYWYGE